MARRSRRKSRGAKKKRRKKSRRKKRRRNKCDPAKELDLDGVIVRVNTCKRKKHKTPTGIVHTVPVVSARADESIMDKITPEGRARIREAVKKGKILVEEEGALVTSFEQRGDKIVGRCPAGSDILVLDKKNGKVVKSGRCGASTKKSRPMLSRKRTRYGGMEQWTV